MNKKEQRKLTNKILKLSTLPEDELFYKLGRAVVYKAHRKKRKRKRNDTTTI